MQKHNKALRKKEPNLSAPFSFDFLYRPDKKALFYIF